MEEKINYGLVKIIKGSNKGRIGLYDDNQGKKALVFFGPHYLCAHYSLISHSNIDDNVTTEDLFKRQVAITEEFIKAIKNDDIEKRENLLSECLLIESIFSKRYFEAKYNENKCGKKISISHSSKDKTFARLLATDLVDNGHSPWLDEWEIKVGHLIPKEITKGLDECEYVIIILSNNSIVSNWVENEWQSKYWDEVEKGKIVLLPVLMQECEIPRLLKCKKYANFIQNYQDGLREVLDALVN